MTEISDLQSEFARILAAAQNGTPAAAQSTSAALTPPPPPPLPPLPPLPPPPSTTIGSSSLHTVSEASSESKYGWVKYVALGCLVAVVAVVVCACLRRTSQVNQNITPPEWDKLQANDGGAEMYNLMLEQSVQQKKAVGQQQAPQAPPQAQRGPVLPAKHPPEEAPPLAAEPPPPENADNNFTTIQQLMVASRQPATE